MSAFTVKSVFSHSVLKPLVAGVVCGAGNQLILGDTNLVSNVYFGGAVAAGIACVSTVEPFVQQYMPTSTPLGAMSKTLESRVMEIALGSASVFALNKFVLKNDMQPSQYLHKLFLIAAADVVAETVCELFMVV